MSKLAPIVLFTYNRLEHTKKTIEALQKNTLASSSYLYIYSDGGQDKESWNKVKEVREYLKTIIGFKKTIIIEQTLNKGLASSIIEGVSNIINKYGKVIVLEDDIITSPIFLTYMNKSLNHYEHIDKVWHINGYTLPITLHINEDTFLWRRMDCWGWATWKNKWQFFRKNPYNLIQTFSKEDIYKFNLDNTHNSWDQVILNYQKKLNTWAIFWYTTIFKNNGLCLSPKISFVKNIGLDGSGVHCSKDTSLSNQKLYDKIDITLINNITENVHAVNIIKKYYQNKNGVKSYE